MKKILPTIFLILMTLTVVGVAVVPQRVEAGWVSTLACIVSPNKCAVEIIGESVLVSLVASIGNLLLLLSSWTLSLAGMILNISIVLTMNIKAIYEATPAIKQIWIIIRNISSIFIIF